MKVLVVHNAYQSNNIGGEDLVVAREIAGLKTQLGQSNVFEYIISNDEIKLLSLAVSIWGNQKHAGNIAHLIQQHQIDIVHVHNFFPLLTPSVFRSAKLAGAIVVHTLHNFRWWCLSGIFYRDNHACEDCVHKKFAINAIVHRCYRNSLLQSTAGALAFYWYHLKEYEKNIDAYFVLSHFQREKLSPLIAANKLWLKPNPIAAPEAVISWEKKKNYVYVGRLESAKGIEVLLATWAQLPETMVLDVIGVSDKISVLKEKYEKNNIRFLGNIAHSDVIKRLAQYRYLVHPSLSYETFGLTLIEALAQGTPVIGFELGTRLEFIQSGKNGFLCQPEKLQETLMRSVDFPHYAALSQQAYESAKDFYTSGVITQQVSIYQQLLGNAG